MTKKKVTRSLSATPLHFSLFVRENQSSLALDICDRMRELVVLVARVTKKPLQRWNRRRWHKELTTLLKRVGPERLERVLTFCRDHVDQWLTLRLPQGITTPRGFVGCFTWLEEKVPKHVVVGDLAQELAGVLKNQYPWPRGSKDQLGCFVQLSLDGHQEFVKKLRDAKQEHDFVHYLVSQFWCNPRDFVPLWTEWVFDWLSRWTQWPEDLTQHAFQVEHTLFRRWGQEQALDFYGDGSRWRKFVEGFDAC